jgi:Tfp pilus assembly protein PilO
MIGGLRDMRTQLLIVAGVLLLLDVAAMALLLSPAGRSRGVRQQKYEQLRQEKMQKIQAENPVQGMDEKIETARDQEAQFNRERLAQRYSTMSEQLSHIAKEAGVSVSNVAYDDLKQDTRSEKPPAGYDGIGITIRVHGSYDQDIQFINAVERQRMLLIIDGVSFEGIKGDSLAVSVHLSTFLRDAA